MKRRYWLIGIPLSIPLFCIGLLVFGSYYGQWRMDTARTEMFVSSCARKINLQDSDCSSPTSPLP